MFDVWTLGHAAWGLFFAWRRLTFWPVVAFCFAWEWFENTVLWDLGWGDPSPVNSVVDVAVAVVACGIAVAVRAWLSGEDVGVALDEWDD